MNPDPTRNSCSLPEEVSAARCFIVLYMCCPTTAHGATRSAAIHGFGAQAYDKDNEKVIEQPLPKVVPVPIVYPMPAPAAPAPSRGRSGLLPPCQTPHECPACPCSEDIRRRSAPIYLSHHSCQLDRLACQRRWVQADAYTVLVLLSAARPWVACRHRRTLAGMQRQTARPEQERSRRQAPQAALI